MTLSATVDTVECRGHRAVQGQRREHRFAAVGVERDGDVATHVRHGRSHSITAEFSGAGFVSSSAPAQTITVSVPDLATTTTLTVPQTARTGTEVTLSADVAPNPGSGTVQFKDNGAEIGAPVAISNGTAQLPHTFSSAGQHSITACSPVRPLHGLERCRAAVTVSVPDQATTTTLTVPQTAETNQQVTLTANLDPTTLPARCSSKTTGRTSAPR